MSSLLIREQPSYFRVCMRHATAYTPVVMAMLAVAALVYKIWGEAVLLCTVASCALAYAFFHKQIRWFINSNDWLPSALRSMFAPVLAFFGGPVGAVTAAAMSFVSSVGDQWNWYNQRRILQGINSELGRSNAMLQQQADRWREQVEQGEKTVTAILQMCPDLQARLNTLDQRAGELDQARLQMEQNQSRLQQFLQYYQSVLGNPAVVEQVSTIARVEAQMTQLNQRLQAWNDETRARVQQGTDVALMQQQNLQTEAELIAVLRRIIQRLTQPAE